MIDKFLDELYRLQTSHDLLEEIWSVVGPYGNEKVPVELIQKLQSHFKFDDSE